MANRDYVIAYDENGQLYISHHGIKGQKWGVRRFQNPDGTWTDAGKKRYLNEDGTLNKRGIKREAKAEYKQKMRDINKRYTDVDKKHDVEQFKIRQDTNLFNYSQQQAKHVKNEYNRSQSQNKLTQEALDAKREYRTKIGKKHVDSLGMKIMQASCNSIAKESELEFGIRYTEELMRLRSYGY